MGQRVCRRGGRGASSLGFTQDIGELYAVAIPSNTRAIATCERLGMQWVGETNKYYDRRTLQVHRIRPADLDDS
jgi:RimJ/RimL family protein N-acetyltransferase